MDPADKGLMPPGAGKGSVQQNLKDHPQQDRNSAGQSGTSAGHSGQAPGGAPPAPHPVEQEKGKPFNPSGGPPPKVEVKDNQDGTKEAPTKPGSSPTKTAMDGQLQGGSATGTMPGTADKRVTTSDDKGKPIQKWEMPGIRFVNNERTSMFVDKVWETFREMNHEAAQDTLGATLMLAKENGVNQDLAEQIIREVYNYKQP